MSWLRRLSRDRSSKIDPDFSPVDNQTRPQSSYVDSKQHQSSGPTKDSQYPSSPEMQRRPPQQGTYHTPPHHARSGSDDSMQHTPQQNSMAPAPDPLTRAFNEALKPYHEKIHLLQADLEAANGQIQTLEGERAAMHNWIDKRGLRPDLPPELSASLAASNSPVAASTLSTQLDRKMTMLNFSLHQLADSMTEPLPVATVSSTLVSVLGQVKYLNSLPAGPAFAFESLIKLAGNFNSHNAGEESGESRGTIENFYMNLDYVMSGVVKKRYADMARGGENWAVERDVRRLEKTAAFLKKELGIQHYFSTSLDVMRNGPGGGGGAGMEGISRYSAESI